MIVASLLLILVAVTLLVLGLTGGSSNLLISSIVASLLAAVALVIGARQSAGARRAAAEEMVPEPAAPRTDDFAAPAEPFAGEPEFAAEPQFAAESQFVQDQRETVQFETAAEDEAFEAGRRDAMAGMRDDLAEEPDYGRAADAINAARSENPEDYAWRRGDAHAESIHADPIHAESIHADPIHAEPVEADLADEGLGEADEDDPADEPLPQVVSPGDAVRIARMDAEVLVVDGRPRYHVPDCQHLIGKLSEPIPVNEAVELGFSPCGLCRPVERLVAAAARH